jgi:hypothetical protein
MRGSTLQFMGRIFIIVLTDGRYLNRHNTRSILTSVKRLIIQEIEPTECNIEQSSH